MKIFSKSPYKNIPKELVFDYTMGNSIPILNWWMNNSVTDKVIWNNEYIQDFIKRYTIKNINSNKEGWSPYGHRVVTMLLNSFQDYDIKNKKIAVIGSLDPWIEAMLINLGNKVTTIEYNVPIAKYDNLECKDYFKFFENSTENFDAIVTFSSIEHSGLGRYGDPLDPCGDLKTMKHIHRNLKSNGILIWGAPVGHDALVWNVHRVYGKIRLPLLFKNFEELKWYGSSKQTLLNKPISNNGFQPVVVLRKM